MPIELLCRKVGNTQIFSEAGECIPVTILEAGSNTVVQKKTPDKDGYSALQLAFGERKASRTSKALAGHYKKAGAAPQRILRESRLTAEEIAAYEVGQQIQVDVFGESTLTGTRRRTSRAYLTFVAVDADGHPLPMPPLALTTEEEKRVAAAAGARRELRLAAKRDLAARS